MVLIVVCCIVIEFYRTGMHLRYIQELPFKVTVFFSSFIVCSYKAVELLPGYDFAVNPGVDRCDQQLVESLGL